MNWKEFLRPTLEKLVILAILFSIFVPFLYYDNGCKNRVCSIVKENAPSVPCQPYGPIPLGLLLINHFDGNNCVTINSVEKISIPFAIFGLLLAYFAACGIISVYYKKIKNK